MPFPVAAGLALSAGAVVKSMVVRIGKMAIMTNAGPVICSVIDSHASTHGMPHITLSAFLKESWPWLLAFLLFLMGLVAAWQWFRKQLRDNADDTAFDSEMLTQCREMLEEGELSAEEFRLIKGRLGQSGLAPSARAPKEQTDKPA